MNILAKKHVTIFSKGICPNEPGIGGWAVVLVYKKHQKTIAGFAKNTTNDRIELTAVLQALIALKEDCQVSIYTDSSYIHNAFDKGWIISWQNNGWLTRYKKPVENQDIWKRILNLRKDHLVYWKKTTAVQLNTFSDVSNYLTDMAYEQIKNNE